MSGAQSLDEPSGAAVPPFLATLIARAAQSLEVDMAASRDYLQRAITIMQAQVTRTARQPGGPLAAWQMKRLVGYIDANLEKRILAKDLGNLLNLSTSHLSRAFKAHSGLSPHQYVISRRVDRARKLLRDTGLPLSQIALDCGLNDQSNLCRLFRRATGQSPQRWRRHHPSPTGPCSILSGND